MGTISGAKIRIKRVISSLGATLLKAVGEMGEGVAVSGDRILVVEDDDEINGIICGFLRSRGYVCAGAYSGTEARMLINARDFDLILCDLMLPGIPGEEVVKIARTRGIPLIVVSAKSDIADKVSLLELGADDYLTKPFDLEELGARVAVQLRKSSVPTRAESGKVQVGAWSIDTMARTLSVDGEEVPFTRIEYNILEVLALHPNRVYTRPELFELAWGVPYESDDNTVNVHLSTLRSKLKPSGTDRYIKTVWGVGFKFVPEDRG